MKRKFVREIRMLHVTGLVDSSLCTIKAQSGPDETVFVSHKCFHVVNVQAIGTKCKIKIKKLE